MSQTYTDYKSQFPNSTVTEAEFWDGLVGAAENKTPKKLVICGDSNAQYISSNSLNTPNSAFSSLLAESGINNIEVYSTAVGGTYISDIPRQIDEAWAAYPDAYIMVITGGNNVSLNRPYSEFAGTQAQTDFEAEIDAMLAKNTNGKVHFNSIIFRTYTADRENAASGKVLDHTIYDVYEHNGAQPFNDNILIPKIAQSYPEQIGLDGRPIGDFYNRFRDGYREELLTDGIHPEPTEGVRLRRKKLIPFINYIVNGGIKPLPIEVEEREITPHEEGLIVVNLGATYGNTVNKFGLEEGVERKLIDEDKFDSGVTFEITSLPAGTSINYNGTDSATSTNLYNGTLNSGVILGNALSIESGGIVAKFKTPNPNTQYTLGACGHEPSSQETRGFGITVQSTEVLSVITSPTVANEPVYTTVTTDVNGEIIMNIEVNLGSFSPIAGLSLKKL